MEVKLNLLEKIKVTLRVIYKITPWKEIFIFNLFTLPFCLTMSFPDRNPFILNFTLVFLLGACSYAFFRWFLYELLWRKEFKPFLIEKFTEESELMKEEVVDNVDKEILVK